ncbi:MAG: DUF6377 domain-containing protein [Muribaculum sp.]|nr:DUF6377 domain-containing protein [Muribaculum sp.]
MKRALIYLFCLQPLLACQSFGQDIKNLLLQLDNLIEEAQIFEDAKLSKIRGIKALGTKAINSEERYWNNSQLYDEYFVFDADSAMQYVNANLKIASECGNSQWEYEWHIKKSFVLSVTGMLNAAKDELTHIDFNGLSHENQVRYYAQQAYLYSHMGQLSDHRVVGSTDYDRISHIYEDSIRNIIAVNSQDYLWYMASSNIDSKKIPDNLIDKLKVAVDKCGLNTRTDAMNCYILSRLYDRKNDQGNRMKYLILSGMADVRSANRDIASIEELATMLLEQGDIDRAYKYINYTQTQALRLPNRIRAASLSKTASELHRLHEDKLNETQRRLITVMILLSILTLLLAILIIKSTRRSKLLRISRKNLEETNEVLTRNMQDLSRAKEEREDLIRNLQTANRHNMEISRTLQEANYVKEECIGATFALCSSYIDRFDEFRKDVLKLVKGSKWKELQDMVIGTSFTNRELKDFYRSFDTLFLNIYPDFVNDFNALLRPEEQKTLNPGELNTELRIYALVRLGISDSVKIAALLHCSTQTVYNYRLRMRNKAVIPKEEFAKTVKSLGKFQPEPIDSSL